MTFQLTAVKRTEKGEKTRAKGSLPAVVYGPGTEPVSLDLAYTDFSKMYDKAGNASLVDLLVDDKDLGKVLIQDVQYDPVKGRMIHVDLRKIDMNRAMTATVILRFTGEVPVIKEAGGTLVRTVEKVEVECLPKDLVSHIDVDLSVLKTFEDAIKIKDLRVPAGITIKSPKADDLVAKATPAMTEEEIKALEEEAGKADVTKIELVEKKVKEGEEEEGAEGGAPTAGKEEKKPAEEKK